MDPTPGRKFPIPCYDLRTGPVKKDPYPFFHMKKLLAAVIVLMGLGLAGMLAHQAVERDREYQRLIRQGDEAMSHGQPFVAIEAFSGAIAPRGLPRNTYGRSSRSSNRR